ncbi:hypothetical protein ORI99_00720 [Alishewanella sp. SMS9]|nr:hypothetical protein [Alishewanella sp. SMS9]
MINETAQQRAWCMGRDEPNQTDYNFAVQFVASYNQQRIELGLKPIEVTPLKDQTA